MPISEIGRFSATPPPSPGGARGAEPGPRPTSGAPAVSSQVSPRARAVRAAAAGVQEAPPIRTEKVFALRGAIASGAYRIDAARIAERLLDQL